MDQRYCKTCERFVDLDDLQIVTESNRITVAFDKKRGIAHDLVSARASKRRLKKMEQPKGEVITVRITAPVPPAAVVVKEVDDPPSGSTHHAVLDEDPFSPQPHEWYDVLVVVVNGVVLPSAFSEA